MAIPRLTPSANPYELNVTVNVNLRPYFEIWYQRKKEPGDTPEQFALRVLKTAALNDYIMDNIKAEQDAIEQAKLDAETAVNTDIQTLNTEVE